mgnify:CR=1 FL=1
MTNPKITDNRIKNIATLLQNGSVSSVELTKEFLERINKLLDEKYGIDHTTIQLSFGEETGDSKSCNY